MKKSLIALFVALIILGGLTLVPIQETAPLPTEKTKITTMDLTPFSDAAPSTKLNALFIHHSCGGQLLAPSGPEKERARCIYESHPYGGNLRTLLTNQGYSIAEASYGSEIADKTDLFDWSPKFKNKMEKILSTQFQDETYKDASKNQIVIFKSCYPNNDFVDIGTAPGNPAGPQLTLWNAKATLSSLLPEFEKHEHVLFVYITAPPIAPGVYPERALKWLIKKALGKPTPAEELARRASIARQFNEWVVSKDGWLKDYSKKNVVVYDYYGKLTNDGASNLSAYPTDNGNDSHPSKAGNERAAAEFPSFLNRAVRRVGLAQ